MNALRELLTGADAAGTDALAALFEHLPDHPRLCWYPSAGGCYRDALVWKHYELLSDWPAPDLLMHTDYMARPFNPLGRPEGRTRVHYRERHALRLTRPVRYCTDPDFAVFAGQAPPRPRIELQDVEIECHILGHLRFPVLYFHFENINWFEEFVLRGGVRFDYLFKLREGCGMGGSRKSVSNIYPFLAHAGCELMVADKEIHSDQGLIRRYLNRHVDLAPSSFRVTNQGLLARMSGMDLHVMSLEPCDLPVTEEGQADRILADIAAGGPWARPVEAQSE